MHGKLIKILKLRRRMNDKVYACMSCIHVLLEGKCGVTIKVLIIDIATAARLE